MSASRRLRPVPEAARRMLGAIRVSKERDGMISPEVQRVAIEDYAAAAGHTITGWVEGLDQSGSRAKSAWWPTLERAVDAVESGEYDGIIVWKYSRIARHRLKWATAIDRVENAGGTIESATEQFDTATSSGRLARGMLGELNTFTAEMIGESWREAHSARVRSGRPHTGKPKWAYVYDQVSKLHTPDPVLGPLLADLYRRYVAGESFFMLARWLNAHGHRTSEGNPWRDSGLRRVMDAGFGAGRFMWHGELIAGVHEPVITEQEWQAYLDARDTRRQQPSRVTRSPHILSGLLRCARCGGSMVANGISGERPTPKYRCANAKEGGPDVCTGGYVSSPLVERQVVRWLEKRAGQVDAASQDAAETMARRVTLDQDVERLAREVARNEESLTRLVVQNAERPLPAATYDRARTELEAAGAKMRASLEQAERERRAVVDDPAAAAATLLEAWDELPVEVRRNALRLLIRKVDIYTRRPEALVKVYGSWELDDDPTFFDRALALLDDLGL